MPNYQDILIQVQSDVTELLTMELPKNLHYHNLTHTAFVVEASLQIGEALLLSQEELNILQIAAWWHDVGYIKTVKGHEVASQAMAKVYLEEQALDNEVIEQVLGCIAATQIPQAPKNLLEQIICDADLAHLAARDFIARCRPLRKEWEALSDKKMTNVEWLEVNQSFMSQHTYFTEYGKEVLEVQKSRNLKRISNKLKKIVQPKVIAPPKTKNSMAKSSKVLSKMAVD